MAGNWTRRFGAAALLLLVISEQATAATVGVRTVDERTQTDLRPNSTFEVVQNVREEDIAGRNPAEDAVGQEGPLTPWQPSEQSDMGQDWDPASPGDLLNNGIPHEPADTSKEDANQEVNDPAEQSSASEDTPRIQEQGSEDATVQGGQVENTEVNATSNDARANMTGSYAEDSALAGQTEIVGDEAEALAGFSLSTADPLGLDPEFRSVAVYQDSALVGSWNSCLTGVAEGHLNQDSCVAEPDYADRVSFSFEIKDMDLPYVITSPQVVAKAGSPDHGILPEPEVVDFSLNRKSSSGSFTVMYRCQKGSSGMSMIELTLPVIRSFNLSIFWLKDCKSGPSKYLELGYVSTSRQVKKFSDGEIVVPAIVAWTDVYVLVIAPATSQEFGAANVSASEANVVTVSTRGSVSKGVASLRDPGTIAVMYDCHSYGKATIFIKVPVPPWDDLEATLVKDCGGSAASISIGTSDGKDDIVSRGITSPGFFTSVPAASDSARRSDVAIPASTREASFVIQNTGGTNDVVHFSNAIMTVGDSKMLRASLKGFLSGAEKYSQEGGMLSPGDAKKMSVHFICLGTGSTWVVVTLPLMRYKSVEFGFTKECTDPKVYEESAIFTVNGILKLLLIGLALVVVGACFLLRAGYSPTGQRSLSEAKYTLVPGQATRNNMR